MTGSPSQDDLTQSRSDILGLIMYLDFAAWREITAEYAGTSGTAHISLIARPRKMVDPVVDEFLAVYGEELVRDLPDTSEPNQREMAIGVLAIKGSIEAINYLVSHWIAEELYAARANTAADVSMPLDSIRRYISDYMAKQVDTVTFRLGAHCDVLCLDGRRDLYPKGRTFLEKFNDYKLVRDKIISAVHRLDAEVRERPGTLGKVPQQPRCLEFPGLVERSEEDDILHRDEPTPHFATRDLRSVATLLTHRKAQRTTTVADSHARQEVDEASTEPRLQPPLDALDDPIAVVKVVGVVGRKAGRSDKLAEKMKRKNYPVAKAARKWYCQRKDAIVMFPRHKHKIQDI